MRGTKSTELHFFFDQEALSSGYRVLVRLGAEIIADRHSGRGTADCQPQDGWHEVMNFHGYTFIRQG